MGSWIERGILIAVGATWVVLAVGVIVAFRFRDRGLSRSWVARDWIGGISFVLGIGLPGALFVLAGSTANRSFIWAAGATMLANLVLRHAVRRYFGTDSS